MYCQKIMVQNVKQKRISSFPRRSCAPRRWWRWVQAPSRPQPPTHPSPRRKGGPPGTSFGRRIRMLSNWPGSDPKDGHQPPRGSWMASAASHGATKSPFARNGDSFGETPPPRPPAGRRRRRRSPAAARGWSPPRAPRSPTAAPPGTAPAPCGGRGGHWGGGHMDPREALTALPPSPRPTHPPRSPSPPAVPGPFTARFHVVNGPVPWRFLGVCVGKDTPIQPSVPEEQILLESATRNSSLPSSARINADLTSRAPILGGGASGGLCSLPPRKTHGTPA